jgi:hypothetical protein
MGGDELQLFLCYLINERQIAGATYAFDRQEKARNLVRMTEKRHSGDISRR